MGGLFCRREESSVDERESRNCFEESLRDSAPATAAPP